MPAEGRADCDEAEPISLSEDLRLLIKEGKALSQAEIAWQKARVRFAASQASGVALLGLLAATLAFFALMALVVGAILALTPGLGPWGATAAVAGGLLVAALLASAIAALRMRHMQRLLADPQSNR